MFVESRFKVFKKRLEVGKMYKFCYDNKCRLFTVESINEVEEVYYVKTIYKNGNCGCSADADFFMVFGSSMDRRSEEVSSAKLYKLIYQ